MPTDLYFDCPLCANTVVVESSLVGQQVDCPDCDSEITVPDIRDGLNPRFKAGEGKGALHPSILTPGTLMARRKEAVPDLILEEMETLCRKMMEQGRQLEYIRFNAELSVKQIHLLQQQSASEGHRNSGRLPQAEEKGTGGSGRHLTLSMAFACLTLVLGVGILVMMAVQR